MNKSVCIVIPAKDAVVTDVSDCPVPYKLCVVRGSAGLGSARNLGACSVEGDLIIMVDSDLKLKPEIWRWLLELKHGWVAMAKVNGHYSTRVFAVHRADFIKAGGFDNSIRYVFEDGDFMHRAYKVGLKHKRVPDNLYAHIEHEPRSNAAFIRFDWEYAKLFVKHKGFMHPRIWTFFTTQTSFKRRMWGVRHLFVKTFGFLYWSLRL